MKKLTLFVTLVLMFWAAAAIAGERAANAYKTTKVSTTSVLVSCVDGGTPKLSSLNGNPSVLITCNQ